MPSRPAIIIAVKARYGLHRVGEAHFDAAPFGLDTNGMRIEAERLRAE
jgi:hypothetical protein